MAGYDFTSQLQGPVIPISLFGDAASQGANVGNAIPTGLTAGIQGAIKGYQEGQQIVATGQENTIRQNQIDNLATTNAIQQQQLKNETAVAQINTTKAAVDTTTQALQIDDTSAKLTNDLQDNQKKIQDRKAEDDFSTLYKNSDPATQAHLVLGGQYNDVLSNNPKLATSVYQQVALNPDNGIDDSTRQVLTKAYLKGTASPYLQNQVSKAQLDLGGLQGELPNQPLMSRLFSKIKDTPLEKIPGAVTLEPHDLYPVDASGYKIYENGAIKTNPVDTSTPVRAYDVFDSNGKRIDDSATPDDKKFQQTYLAKWAIAHGSNQQRFNSQIDQMGANTQTGGGFPSSPAPKVTDYRSLAQTSLGLPKESFDKVSPSIDILKSQISNYVQNPATRGSVAGDVAINNTIKTVARSISDTTYDTRPDVQAQFTESHVLQYNENLDKQLNAKLLAQTEGTNYLGQKTYGSGTMFGQPVISPEIVDAFRPLTPKDLYFINQRDAITANLNKIRDTIQRQEQSKVNESLNKASAIRNNLGAFAGIVGGQ